MAKRKAAKKKNKAKKSMFFPKLILAAFVIYAVSVLISLQVDINAEEEKRVTLEGEKKEELLKQEQYAQAVAGEEIDLEYAKDIAEQAGYGSSDTRVYKDISGQ